MLYAGTEIATFTSVLMGVIWYFLEDGDMMKIFASCGALLQWTNLVFRIRCFSTTGPFIRITIVTILECKMFMFLFCIYLIGFGQASAHTAASRVGGGGGGWRGGGVGGAGGEAWVARRGRGPRQQRRNPGRWRVAVRISSSVAGFLHVIRWWGAAGTSHGFRLSGVCGGGCGCPVGRAGGLWTQSGASCELCVGLGLPRNATTCCV